MWPKGSGCGPRGVGGARGAWVGLGGRRGSLGSREGFRAHLLVPFSLLIRWGSLFFADVATRGQPRKGCQAVDAFQGLFSKMLFIDTKAYGREVLRGALLGVTGNIIQ